MRLELDRENTFNPGPVIVPGDVEALYRLPPNTSPGNLFARMPSLRYFAGEALYLPFVAKESALCGATLSWYNEVEDAIVDAIRTLEEASRESLVYLSCRRRGWNLDLLRAVAESLPDLLALELVDTMMVQAFPPEVMSAFAIGSLCETSAKWYRFIGRCEHNYGSDWTIHFAEEIHVRVHGRLV
jgi:hypothetical protein